MRHPVSLPGTPPAVEPIIPVVGPTLPEPARASQDVLPHVRRRTSR
jgi:hypothetical protein